MKKLYRLFCFFICLSLSPLVEAEQRAVRLSLQAEDVCLSDVLGRITEQTGVHFSYNPREIDGNSKVSYTCHEKGLEQVLGEVLPTAVEAKYKGKYVILTPALPKPVLPVIHSEHDFEKIKEDTNQLIDRADVKNLEKIRMPDTGMLGLSCHSNVNLKNEKEMNEHLTALVLATTMALLPATAQESENLQTDTVVQQTEVVAPPAGTEKAFQFSFIYPLSTDWLNSQENTYRFSLNLVGGVTGRLNGLELGTAFNINKYSARGAQFAGAFNMAGCKFSEKEESKVFQASAGFNYVNAGSAVQLAGGFNVSDKAPFQASAGFNLAKEAGAQFAGGINMARTAPFQASAGFNLARQSAVQLAGGFNVAKQSAVQASAGLNVAQKSSFQLAGGLNVAKESDCQIACLNVTKHGGFQLGVVNVRDTADGVSVGLLNIVKRGGLCDFGIEGGEMIHTALTFRAGTYRFYTLFSGGVNYEQQFVSAGFGLGTGFRFTNWLGLNLELIHHNLFGKNLDNGDYNALVQFRPLVDFRIARHFKVFAGPVFNLLIQSDYGSPDKELKRLTTPFKPLLSTSIPHTPFNDTALDGWIGFTVGMRF